MPKLHYLKFKTDQDYPKFSKGDCIIVVATEEDGKVTYQYASDKYTQYTLDHEALENMEEISETTFNEYSKELHSNIADVLQQQLKDSMAGVLGDAIDESQALVHASKFSVIRNKVLGLSKQAETLQSIVLARSGLLKSHAASLQIKLELERTAMEQQMLPLQQQMEALQHALHMANLYLGTNEMVIPIAEGLRAPATAPIVIRQRILFMDEECALIDAEGIDCHKLNTFDKLVTRPDLLKLIIPDEKGVVVLKVSRNPKKYKGLDPVTQMYLDEENSKTYWLIKNGECLWRFWADFDTPATLFPKSTHEVSEHRPGSKEYYSEMKKEKGIRLQFMKAGLLLQGIIDRTKIFEPFIDKQPPILTEPATWDGKIAFVYDDENNLSEGLEPYTKWLASLNKVLYSGQRIAFAGYCNDEERVIPNDAYGYSDPEIRIIHKGPKGFYFNFENKRSYNKKKTGKIIVRESDTNWINIDFARVTDMERYLHSREVRSNFRAMVPLLQLAIALKKEEESEETLFKALIIKTIEDKHGSCDMSKLEKAILWWKGKKQVFAPLVGNDVKNNEAYLGIVTKYQDLQTPNPELSEITNIQAPNLVVAYMSDPRTVTAYYQEDKLPIFFEKSIFNHKKGKWIKTKTTAHCIISPEAFVHPATLFIDRIKLEKAARSKSGYISPASIEALFGQTVGYLLDLKWENYTPLVIYTVQKSAYPYKQEFFVTLFDHNRKNYTNRQLTFKKGEFTSPTWSAYSTPNSLIANLNEELKPRSVFEEHYQIVTIIAVAADNLKACTRAMLDYQALNSIKESKKSFINNNSSRLESHLIDEWTENIYKAYLKDGGDVTLFKDHLKTVKRPSFLITPLELILSEVLLYTDTSISDVCNTSFEQVKQKAKQSFQSRKRDFFCSDTWDEKEDNFTIPGNFKLADC